MCLKTEATQKCLRLAQVQDMSEREEQTLTHRSGSCSHREKISLLVLRMDRSASILCCHGYSKHHHSDLNHIPGEVNENPLRLFSAFPFALFLWPSSAPSQLPSCSFFPLLQPPLFFSSPSFPHKSAFTVKLARQPSIDSFTYFNLSAF